MTGAGLNTTWYWAFRPGAARASPGDPVHPHSPATVYIHAAALPSGGLDECLAGLV